MIHKLGFKVTVLFKGEYLQIGERQSYYSMLIVKTGRLSDGTSLMTWSDPWPRFQGHIF